MPVHVGTAVFDDWKAMEYPPAGWTDTFILEISHNAGLPPGDYADGLKRLKGPLKKLRPGASIWIKVDAPGMWYAREVRRVLRRTGLSIAVTHADVIQPKVESFSVPPYTIRVSSGPPSEAEALDLRGLQDDSITCLRVLARIDEAYTAEVAALGGLWLDKARKLLRELKDLGYVEYVADHVTPASPKQIELIGDKVIGRNVPDEKKSYPFWRVTRKGTSLALRSWGLPPEYRFDERKEHRTPMDSRHRRVSRQWPACWNRRRDSLYSTIRIWSRGLYAEPQETIT